MLRRCRALSNLFGGQTLSPPKRGTDENSARRDPGDSRRTFREIVTDRDELPKIGGTAPVLTEQIQELKWWAL